MVSIPSPEYVYRGNPFLRTYLDPYRDTYRGCNWSRGPPCTSKTNHVDRSDDDETVEAVDIQSHQKKLRSCHLDPKNIPKRQFTSVSV